jgi:hypothetical protein
MTDATGAKLEEIQQLREELAHQQDIAMVKELRTTIVVNECAIPHLFGLPKRHAEQRVTEARANLATLELLISLR